MQINTTEVAADQYRPSNSQSSLDTTGKPAKATRYPGPDPFQDDETDSLIFFGRDAEVEEVQSRLLSNKLLVLYAKSGLGKTSMLQAGLFPKLRERDLLPIRLRFNHRHTTLLEELHEAVSKTCQSQHIAFSPGVGDSYWEYFNSALFSKGERFLTPVLILDQFEEIFTLQSEQYQTQLGEQLGYLVSGQTPESVRERIRAGDKSTSVAMPNVRILLSLREDSVGALQELVSFLPGILSQRFRLTQLHRERARNAIVNPAQLPHNESAFISRPFSYREDTVTTMLDYLQDKRGNIEPFQLQLLCHHIELQVIQNQARSAKPIVVDVQGYLGGAEGMDKIIKRFYQTAINSLAGWRVKRKARNLCETGLINPDGRRESLSRGQIKHSFGLKKAALDQLVEKKVLRREQRLDDFAYELSHDSLALAVFKSRRSKIRLKWLVLAAVFILLPLSGFVWQRLQTQQVGNIASANLEAYKQQVQELVALHRKGNRTIKEPEMVKIPSGVFSMGGKGYSNEKPVHEVTIPAFSMAAYEVTFEAYDQFAATKPGYDLPDDVGWGRGKRPVINVSWIDATAYAAWLSKKTGKRYRLPSEAEWEYAARAGTTGNYYWGDQEEAEDYAWFTKNANEQTQPVRKLKPNAFGLYDMSGNVWEWVGDCWHNNYAGAPVNGSSWQKEHGGDCGRRVLRGGSWTRLPAYLRSANRDWFYTGDRDSDIGFRLAQD